METPAVTSPARKPDTSGWILIVLPILPGAAILIVSWMPPMITESTREMLHISLITLLFVSTAFAALVAVTENGNRKLHSKAVLGSVIGVGLLSFLFYQVALALHEEDQFFKELQALEEARAGMNR